MNETTRNRTKKTMKKGTNKRMKKRMSEKMENKIIKRNGEKSQWYVKSEREKRERREVQYNYITVQKLHEHWNIFVNLFRHHGQYKVFFVRHLFKYWMTSTYLLPWFRILISRPFLQ